MNVCLIGESLVKTNARVSIMGFWKGDVEFSVTDPPGQEYDAMRLQVGSQTKTTYATEGKSGL